MNWDRSEGSWKEFMGRAKEQWGKLTDDDLDQIDGKREALSGRLQNRYGMAKDEADRQIPVRGRPEALGRGLAQRHGPSLPSTPPTPPRSSDADRAGIGIVIRPCPRPRLCACRCKVR